MRQILDQMLDGRSEFKIIPRHSATAQSKKGRGERSRCVGSRNRSTRQTKDRACLVSLCTLCTPTWTGLRATAASTCRRPSSRASW